MGMWSSCIFDPFHPAKNGRAYKKLVEGANTLLDGHLAWTARLLLRLVRHLYTRRLILPDEMVEELLAVDEMT